VKRRSSGLSLDGWPGVGVRVVVGGAAISWQKISFQKKGKRGMGRESVTSSLVLRAHFAGSNTTDVIGHCSGKVLQARPGGHERDGGAGGQGALGVHGCTMQSTSAIVSSPSPRLASILPTRCIDEAELTKRRRAALREKAASPLYLNYIWTSTRCTTFFGT